jgi:hypothetical protein
MSILPDVPRLSTVRNTIADCVFVVLHGFSGFCAGLAVGAIVGFMIRRSLGMRGRNLTRGYHLRMFERGCGESPGQLETLVELLRGNRLTMMQCRHIACAYAEAVRHLQSCHSMEERASILRKRNRQVLEIAYGERAIAAYHQDTRQPDQLPPATVVSENAE